MKKRLLKILSIVLISLCTMFVLTACLDADHLVQVEKMRQKGYHEFDLTQTGGYDIRGAKNAYEFVINNTADDAAERVFVLYFASDHDAILYEVDFLEYDYPNLVEGNPDAIEDKGYQYTRVGKVFIHGTDYAFKDALA